MPVVQIDLTMDPGQDASSSNGSSIVTQGAHVQMVNQQAAMQFMQHQNSFAQMPLQQQFVHQQQQAGMIPMQPVFQVPGFANGVPIAFVPPNQTGYGPMQTGTERSRAREEFPLIYSEQAVRR